MAPHVKNERLRLLRTMEQMLDRLAKSDAEAVAIFRSSRAALEALDTPEDTRYAKFRRYKDAIDALLENEGEWLHKRVIADKLFRGGFSMDPEMGPRLVVDNLNANIRRGNYQEDEDGRVGLLSWKLEDATIRT